MKLLFFLALFAMAQERNPFRSDLAAAEAGRQTFLGACSACHGANGEGGQGPNLVTGRRIGRLSDRQLFHSIKDGLPGTDMPPFRLPDEKVWQLVSYVRSMSAPAVTMRLPGDANRGAAIFSGKGGCAGCHRLRGVGGALGPDLTNIGALRTVHLLRQAVVEPNARIESGFQSITCVDANGTEIRGVAKN
jgi:mono/diheme cytochrome c family protein